MPRGDFAPMRSNNAERTLRPLWVISGHCTAKLMSALPPKADMCSATACPLCANSRHSVMSEDRPGYTNSGCLIFAAVVGNSNWKMEPPFAPGDTQIRPPWVSMIDWQIDRPIPIPRSLVVNIG